MEKRHRKIKRRRLIQILSIILVFLIVICIVMLLWGKKEKKQQTPEIVLKAYYKALNEKNYEEMYDFLTEDARAKIAKEEFVKRNQNIYEGIEASKITIHLTKEAIRYADDQKSASAEYETSMHTIAGEITFTASAEFVKNDEKDYRINWSSEMIYPELLDQYKLRVNTTKAKRGEILDRNGIALAKNGIVTNVGLVPGKMGENRQAAEEQLASLLGISAESIRKKLEAGWVTEESFVPIKEIAKGNTELETALLGIPGVMLSDTEERVYPFGAAAGHLTGYVASVSAEDLETLSKEGYHSGSVIGKSGLEKAYESRLRPIDGAEILILNEEGEQVGIMAQKNPQDGETITVSIDSAVQQNTYEQFAEDEGAAVAMNPKTGEVMALVSTPGMDPNEFVLGMSDARWEALNQDPMMPLTNRYHAAWVPGSTLKPIVGAIGVESNSLDPNANLGDVGLSWQKDASWGNYFVTTLTAYGDQVTLQNALVYSDNIYFARAALQMGEAALVDGLKKFGFGETMEFDLKLTASSYSSKETIDNEIQLADSGYGQGEILVNPVHMASMYSAFVNDGNMIQPVLVTGKTPTYWKEQVISPNTAEIIRNAMKEVIEREDGTGHAMKIDGLMLCGKTGTAETKQSQEESGATEYGWFACSTTEETERPLEVIAMVKDVQAKGVKGYVTKKVRNIYSSYYQLP